MTLRVGASLPKFGRTGKFLNFNLNFTLKLVLKALSGWPIYFSRLLAVLTLLPVTMGVHKFTSVDPHLSEDVEYEDDASQSSEDDDDDNWEDWNSDPQTQTHCFSLFDDCQFKSASEALLYDKDKYAFDLDHICRNLCALKAPIYIFYGSL